MKFIQERVFIILLIVTGIAIGSLTYIWQQSGFDKSSLNMTALNKTRQIAPVILEDGQGKSFSTQKFAGQWTLLFFGFTRCHMLCPTTMSELNQAMQMLDKKSVGTFPRVALVSIDSDHDTGSRVDAYAKGFNKNFIGLAGSKANIKNITDQLGIAYFATKGEAAKQDLFDHSGAIVVLNPKGDVFGFYTTAHSAKIIANDFTYIDKQWSE